ncbi:MAG: 2-hydroxychromene-2-carboxylate isomerase [Myxococcales bacterium]|nr:2-hydroxychromene-2-carboxylate isomerase [Myxococcales bacterium]
MKTLEFWFDFSCPYAYVASTRVEALAERVGARLDARPMLLGGVFMARGVPQNLSQTLAPAKARHNLADMQRQARRAGVPLTMPAGHPLRTVDALRCVLAAGEPYMPLAHRFYRAYWAEGRDIGEREVVAEIVREVGLDADAVMARASGEEIKQELRRRTDEAIARGVFGVPTFFVEEQLYWGADRMDMVEAALGGAPTSLRPAAGSELAATDVWFDYSSPFAYLAMGQVEAVFGAAARWRPLLLGGLFRDIGTPDVPLFTQSPEKRRHTMVDMQRQAARAGLAFRWPTRFPVNTVLPLRMTLAGGLTATREGRALIVAIARALWAEDRDIGDPAVLAGLADAHGFDGAGLVAAAGAPEAKQSLRASTAAAQADGVFGVPTFVVHTRGGDALYWGADRIDAAARAAAEHDAA